MHHPIRINSAVQLSLVTHTRFEYSNSSDEFSLYWTIHDRLGSSPEYPEAACSTASTTPSDLVPNDIPKMTVARATIRMIHVDVASRLADAIVENRRGSVSVERRLSRLAVIEPFMSGSPLLVSVTEPVAEQSLCGHKL